MRKKRAPAQRRQRRRKELADSGGRSSSSSNNSLPARNKSASEATVAISAPAEEANNSLNSQTDWGTPEETAVSPRERDLRNIVVAKAGGSRAISQKLMLAELKTKISPTR